MDLNHDSMAKLLEISGKIVQKKSLEEKICVITDTVKSIICADRCSIFVHDKKTKSFWTIHADDISYIELPDSMGIISKVYENKEIILDNNVDQNLDAIKSVDNDYKTLSMLSMPIFGYDNECIGVVQLLNKHDEDGFNETDVKVLQFVMNHFTTFIQMMVYENS